MSTVETQDRPFIKGLELAELFYREAVKPILATHFSNLAYSAALLGLGSEVLGFDTPQSMDHDWGPRLMLFLTEEDHPVYSDEIDRLLRRELPSEIHGYPTDMARGDARGTAKNHSVMILTVRGFIWHVLHYDLDAPLRAADWLTFPQQLLRSIVTGRVFYDGLGQLEAVRARLHYYPHDVWLYLLASQWARIGQEEAFMGRCGQVGDDLGSRLVAARLARDLIRLCFMMERQYVPFIKWFGTAFARLECAGRFAPLLTCALEAHTWQEREVHLSAAYEHVAGMHNDLGITDPMPTQVRQFWDRPFLVINADRFIEAIRAVIASEEVLALPEHLGAVDQFIDSTDALNHWRFRRLGVMYEQVEE